MRFKLVLHINREKFGDKIPCSYSYELSSVIYRILSRSGSGYSSWLHDNGFKLNGKPFKLFTFSRLHIPRFHIEGEFIRLLSDTVTWQLSFLPERSTQEFIRGVFLNQAFELGVRGANVSFVVQQVSVAPSPNFSETMEFETLSPICISLRREDGRIDYLSPDNPEAPSLIRQNLLNKYFAFHGKEYANPAFDFSFTTLSKPKSVLVTVKSGTPQQTRVRGFRCRFRVTAPIELITVLYEAGIGEKGSLGFGMVKELQ